MNSKQPKTRIKTKIDYLLFLEWALLLVALFSFSITEEFKVYLIFALIFLIFSFLLRIYRSNHLVPKTQLEIPGALFIGSAAISVWIAYDRPTAFLQFCRILAACVLFYAVCDSRERHLRWIAASLLLAATILALYWPIQHDFFSAPAKYGIINLIGRWINRTVPQITLESITGSSIHSNVAAGTLALALPFSCALLWDSIRNSRTPLILVSLISTLAIIFSLIMTSSRGAWMGVLTAAFLLFLIWIQRRYITSPFQRKIFWGILLIIAFTGAAILFATGNIEPLLGQIPDPSGSLQSRTALWRHGVGLIRDYPFTGSGLMTFWMVYSAYSLLIHPEYLAHIHNSILQVWIEQGILGVIALGFGSIIILKWTWNALGKKGVLIWGWAGLASLIIIAVHGIVDVVFYVERTLPIIGLAIGFTWFLTPHKGSEIHNYIPAQEKDNRYSLMYFSLGTVIIIILFSLIFYSSLNSLIKSNMGTISQTQKELSTYDTSSWDEFPLDEVRRSIDLNDSLVAFRSALIFNPGNITAIHRQAQIALSLQRFEDALKLTQLAWDKGYRDDVTKLLYGDALAANGYPSEAAQAVKGINWAEERLLFQAVYRYQRDQDFERAAHAWQAALLLNPNNSQAQKGLESIQSKLER